jgi:hypothetical protein
LIFVITKDGFKRLLRTVKSLIIIVYKIKC